MIELADDAPLVRVIGSVLIGASLVLLVALPVWAVAQVAAITSIDQFLRDAVRPVYWDLRGAILFWVSPFVLLAAPVLLALSAVLPSDQSQPVFSRGLLQGAAWSFTTKIFAATLRIQDAVNHTNIRLNLGPLRYVFVSPQLHRVHHSIEARQYDSSFGAILSIWDHIFGTQHRRYDEYPITGIPDSTFPLESAGRTTPGRVLLGQLVYPFRELYLSAHALIGQPDFAFQRRTRRSTSRDRRRPRPEDLRARCRLS